MKTGIRFKRVIAMPKKKSDTEKKPKEVKATKAPKKAAPVKPEKKAKPARATTTAVPVPEPVAAAPKPAPAPAPAAEKPKMTLPKKPAQIKRPAITITIEDISLRAYYIAERRKGLGWLGDETSDWVEAERQLVAEAAKKPR